jgi:NADH:ubiquinone oxidoreductase subunit 4 (subunit M)
MLRAYRAIFMGAPNEQRLPGRSAPSDLARTLRLPVILLIAATMIVGFFPNTLLQLLRPTFSAPVAANR